MRTNELTAAPATLALEERIAIREAAEKNARELRIQADALSAAKPTTAAGHEAARDAHNKATEAFEAAKLPGAAFAHATAAWEHADKAAKF